MSNRNQGRLGAVLVGLILGAPTGWLLAGPYWYVPVTMLVFAFVIVVLAWSIMAMMYSDY